MNDGRCRGIAYGHSNIPYPSVNVIESSWIHLGGGVRGFEY